MLVSNRLIVIMSASPAVIMIVMSTHLLHFNSADNHHDASSASPAVIAHVFLNDGVQTSHLNRSVC